MPNLPAQTPSQILSDLLLRHPEAASMLSEADHRRELAYLSATAERRSSGALAASRRRLEILRRRLDPRNRRRVKAGAGLAALAIITGCLVALDTVELNWVNASDTLPLAMCATTTWLMAAWNGALADRGARQTLWTLIATGTAWLALLIGIVHALAVPSVSAHPSDRVAESAIACPLIAALTASASALISRIEPLAVATARASLRHSHRRHRRAARQERHDAEAATIATQAWLNLVRRHAIAVQPDFHDDAKKSVQAALALATALISLGRPTDA